MTQIRTIVLWPFSLISVLTKAKDFSRNPVIGSKTLNRWGLHRWRLKTAGQIGRWRSGWLKGGIAREQIDAFEKNGFVAVPDFLSSDEVASVRDELLDFNGEARRMVQGDCWTERILLTASRLKQFPTVKKLVKRRDFKRLLAFTATKWHVPLFYIQRIHHLEDQPEDPQKTMHSDTFHPTMKAWLFLEDIQPDMGPFTYVPGSHKFSEKRAAYETEIALSHETLSEHRSGRGSIRANEDALQRMGMNPRQGLCFKAGTLVLANTNGYHGRGQATPGATRLEIFTYSRVSPFIPLPFGLPDPFWLMAEGLDAWHRYSERRAKRRGGYPTWRTIPLSDMTKGLGKSETPTDAR